MTWGLASGIVPACQSPADVPGPAARSYFFFFDAAFFFVDFFAAFLAPFFFMAILRSPPRALVDRVSGPCGPRNRGFRGPARGLSTPGAGVPRSASLPGRTA